MLALEAISPLKTSRAATAHQPQSRIFLGLDRSFNVSDGQPVCYLRVEI